MVYSLQPSLASSQHSSKGSGRTVLRNPHPRTLTVSAGRCCWAFTFLLTSSLASPFSSCYRQLLSSTWRTSGLSLTASTSHSLHSQLWDSVIWSQDEQLISTVLSEVLARRLARAGPRGLPSGGPDP